ncbi:MAG: CpsD/CapB family tyrosine-protein kinase [Candidatus Omnitrophota bacterium]
MGKFTDALKKATEERMGRIERIAKVKEAEQIVIRKMGDSNVDSRIISYFDVKSPVTEQYKILKTNLLSLNKGRPPKTVVITSSIHSEGKTITALNLGITMAHAINNPKILVIDADLRRGRLARYLGVDQKIGLSEILQGKAQAEDALFKIDIDNLTFMACGETPHHPVELLGSDKMKQLLTHLKSKFDFILIDTPPLISVTDPGILGAESDGVILVVQAGRTQRGIVRRAMELLHQAKANLLGQVLTNVEYHLPEYIYRYL